MDQKLNKKEDLKVNLSRDVNLSRKVDKNKEQLMIPNKTAVAISYNPDDLAPKIIASGRGYLAEKIISTAKDKDIPLHKDVKLANTMAKLEVGDFIPKELYEVVSEILVFVDKMDNLKKKLDMD